MKRAIEAIRRKVSRKMLVEGAVLALVVSVSSAWLFTIQNQHLIRDNQVLAAQHVSGAFEEAQDALRHGEPLFERVGAGPKARFQPVPPMMLLHNLSRPIGRHAMYSLRQLEPVNRADYLRPDERRALGRFRGRRPPKYVAHFETSDGEVLRYMQPIRLQKDCLQCHKYPASQIGRPVGVLTISIPSGELWVHYTKMRNMTAWSASAMLTVIAIFGSIFLHVTISTPLSKLNHFVTRLRDGDLSARSEVRTGDEFQRIGTTLEEMAGNVAELTGSLEQKVREATSGLYREQSKLKSIVSSMAEGIMVTDSKGRIILWNPAAETLTTVPAAEALGHTQDDVFRTLGVRGAKVDFSQKPIENTIFTGLSFTMTREDRQTYYAGLSAPVLDEAGVLIGRVSAFRDTTTEHEVDEMKSAFVSLVAHELRTPLSAIKAYAQTLLRKDVEFDEASEEEFLAVIDSEADRLARLINNLLDIGRAEAGRMKLVLAEVDVNEAVREAVAEMRRMPETSGFRFEAKVDPDLPSIVADNDRVIGIVVNLLSNAFKYAAVGGRTLVSARRDADGVEVSVRDWGPGLTQEAAGKLFRRFERAGATAAVAGVGLGLYTVRLIVEAHKGRIWVETEEGEGSTFKFWLPTKGPGKEKAEAAPPKEAA